MAQHQQPCAVPRRIHADAPLGSARGTSGPQAPGISPTRHRGIVKARSPSHRPATTRVEEGARSGVGGGGGEYGMAHSLPDCISFESP